MKTTFLTALSSVLFTFYFVFCAPPLEFENEPTSRLVKLSDGRAVFRCDPSPPNAEIRWLYNGNIISHNRHFKISGQRLIVHLNKGENSSRYLHHLDPRNDVYFQCEIRHKGKVLLSGPAKLIIAVLEEFPSLPNVLISSIVGNTAVIPCDPPHSVPLVVTEFAFNDTVIDRTTGNKTLMPSGDLQILNVQKEDAGEYICIANNPFSSEKVTSKRKVILQVEDSSEKKPTSFIKSPRSKIATALGSNITLECAAIGNPTPTITWKKHDGKLPHGRHSRTGGNLHIINVKRGDEGRYICQVENGNGGTDARFSDVEIQESPQIFRSFKSMRVEIGQTVNLTCQARGHPKPSIMWIHNGKEIHHKGKHEKLTLSNFHHKHAGIYQCFASNNLGTTYTSGLLHIATGNSSDDLEDIADYNSGRSHHKKTSYEDDYDDEDDDDEYESPRRSHNSDHYGKRKHKRKHNKGVKLVPPSKPEVTRLTNTSVMVRWTVGKGGLPINFFKVQYKEVGKKNEWETVDDDIATHIHSYAVPNLKTGAAFRFRIAAVYSNHDNKASPVSNKFILYKDPPMEKPSNTPIITYAEAASPSAITLHWEYNDIDSKPVEGFFIHYRATHNAGKYLKVTVLGSNTRSHIISHLLPETAYDIKMQCFNEAGTSDFSNIYTAKTKESDISHGSRNKIDEEEINMMDTETVSSSSKNDLMLYVILGSVLGILVIIICVATVLYCRKKQTPHANQGNSEEMDDDINVLKKRNGHVTSNGYIAVNGKVNINVNPLTHLDLEDIGKPNGVSNNNEIIRLQTFSISALPQAEPLLNDSERASIHEVIEINNTATVISQNGSVKNKETTTSI